MYYRPRIFVLGMLCAFFTSQIYADLSKPNYVPSANPHYALIEAGTHSATIQFAEIESESSYRENTTAYVGIPIGATVEIELLEWDFSLYKSTTLVGRFNKPSHSEYKEGLAWIRDAIKTKTRAFQEIDLYEVTIDPSTHIRMEGETRRHKLSLHTLLFRVAWEGGNTVQSTASPRPDAGYARLYKSYCLNAEQMNALRRKRTLPDEEKRQGFIPFIAGYQDRGAVVNPAFQERQPRQDAVRIAVRKTGIVKIPARDLIHAGIDLPTVDPSQLRLWHEGEEKHCFLNEDGNGTFEQGESIVFYGRESESEFTENRTYFLTWADMDTPPKRIPSQPMQWVDTGTPTFPCFTVKDDENILVKKHANDFKWFMMQMDQKTKSLVLDSPDMVPEGEVEINFSLLNKTPGTCNFAIFVEDVTTSYSLPIAAATTVTYTVPAETLIQSPTIFIHQKTRIHEPSFKKTGASEKVENVPYLFVKKVEYQYPRQAIVREAPLVFHHQVWPATMEAVSLRGQENLTGPLSAWVIQDGDILLRLEAEQLPEGKSLALPPEWERVEIHATNHIPEIFRAHADYPSTLHRIEQGYDYIIIAYRTMMEEAKKLAERRAEDGFSVLLTDIQDIYDEFNYGYPNYDALVRFLRYAQSEWRGLSPEFVVLIGDSSWDHRDRENMGCVDQIPSYAPLNNPQRFAEDDYYTQLWGNEDDYFADVIIGRISVREPHELAQYLTKMELYEDDLPVGPWKARNFLVADNTFERYSYTAVETSIPSCMVTDQVHQVDYPHFTNSFFYNMFKDNPDPTTREYLNKKYCPECTEEIIDGFNEGALFVQYIGHGGNQIWSHERIFYGTNRTYSDVLRFEPTRKFPFVMNWSCLTGYLNFNIPPFNVCLAEELLRYPDRGGIAIWAPSGGGSTEYHMVLLHLNVRNMLNRHLVRFGESITQAKIEFLSRNRSPDITKQYVLFGDPALSLSLPKDELKVEVEPDSFLPETQQMFTVQSHVPSFKEGKAITYVTANGKTVYKSPVFAFTGSRIVHSATVSLEAGEYSNASVGIYAWNGRDNVDAWGGTTIPAYEPRLVAKNGKALVSDGKAFVIFDLFNDSPFAAEKVTCHLLIGGASHTVEAASVPANATTTLRWEGAVAQNAVMAFVTVHGNEDYNLSGREEDRELAIPLRAIHEPTVIPMIHKMTATALELIEHDTEQLRIPMFNPTGELVEAAFQLDGPGSATTEYNLKIPADREISARFSVTFPAAGDYTYVLHTSVADASYTTKIPLSIKRQPDLVFLQEDMRIEPEAPVLGRTVYFYGRIANVGEGPAKNIAVQAFDGPPKQGKKLSNFDGSTNVKIPLLPPGEDTPFEITWDPESYEGLGEHEIHLVVDKYNRVPESNEDNNTLIKKVVLHNLPDLKVDPTGDHQLTLRGETVPIYEWGRPLHVTGRMRNQGESDAEYARLTMVHNKTEYHTVFDRIRAGGANETRFDVPLVSAKNSLIIYADKYDLVGETDDTGNNVSFNERLYVKLKMPEAKKREGRRVYEVKTETHFTAGQSEFLHFDETKEALVMHPDLNEVNVRVLPQYVEDKDSFVTVQTRFQWRWNPKFNRFVAPIEKLGVLEARVPSPQGRYEVFLDLHSSIYDENGKEILYCRPGEKEEYIEIAHEKDPKGKTYKSIGIFDLEDDFFSLALKNRLSDHETSVGDVRFVRVSDEENPVSTGFLSPLYPATGSGEAPARMEWDAYLRQQTDMRFRARWVVQKGNDYYYLPWTEFVPAAEGHLELEGKGDYLQFHAEFVRESNHPVTPELNQVRISIPCQ